MGDCLRRSFTAGLRWCGINDDVPNIQWSGEAEQLANKYGLVYTTSFPTGIGNNPAIVVYKDAHSATDSEYHAVFSSDIAPFVRWEVYAYITGWECLMSRDNATEKSRGVYIGEAA